MSNLSQDDIDALISGISKDPQAPKPPVKPRLTTRPPKGPASYRLYDFRRPDKLSKEQVRLLRASFGRFTRGVNNYLTGLVRATVDVKLLEVDQTTYKEIFRSHGIPTLLCTYQIDEQNQGLLKVNLYQMYAALDRLMGGPGNGMVINRPLTDFERGLMSEICSNILLHYAETVHSVRKLELETLDTDERLISRTLAAEEIMVRATYELRLGSTTGQLSLHAPLKCLSPLVGKMNRRNQERRSENRRQLPKSLSTMPLTVQVDLGTLLIDASTLARLHPGDLLTLDQEVAKPLQVNVGGVPRFGARPGIIGNRMAVVIEGEWRQGR